MTMQDSFPTRGNRLRAFLARRLHWRRIRPAPLPEAGGDRARRAFLREMSELCPEAFASEYDLHAAIPGLSGRY